MSFKPHGLIRTRLQQALYNAAHIANVTTGIADPKEAETVSLLEAILNQNIFNNNEHYAVQSQRPPNPESKRACDLVIRYLDNELDIIQVLCFIECKRTRTNKEFSLRDLENQAMSYCESYLSHYTNIPFVYAITAAGAHVRLWKLGRGEDKLTPFWGLLGRGNWLEYRDLGDDAAGLGAAFEKMKELPPTPHAGQDYGSYHASMA